MFPCWGHSESFVFIPNVFVSSENPSAHRLWFQGPGPWDVYRLWVIVRRVKGEDTAVILCPRRRQPMGVPLPSLRIHTAHYSKPSSPLGKRSRGSDRGHQEILTTTTTTGSKKRRSQQAALCGIMFERQTSPNFTWNRFQYIQSSALCRWMAGASWKEATCTGELCWSRIATLFLRLKRSIFFMLW